MEIFNIARIAKGFIRHSFAYIMESKRRIDIFLTVKHVSRQHKKALMRLKNKKIFEMRFFCLRQGSMEI